MTDAARRPSRGIRPLHLAVAAMLAVAAVVAASFFVTGGRFFVVRTPSMGTAAPVGTLVLTRPVDFGRVHVGDVIAFHPPTEPGATFTHRVVAKTATGIRTKGDINGVPDPWTVTRRDLIGEASVVLPGVGWLIRALPILVIGGLLVWGLTRAFVSPARRGPARQFGGAVVFMIAAVMLRPFVGVAQLSSAATPSGESRVAVVSTGLLPVRLTASGDDGHAAPLDLAMGETGVSTLRGGRPGAEYHLQTALHLQGWQWALAVIVVLSPVLWTLLVGFRPGSTVRRGVSHRAVPA